MECGEAGVSFLAYTSRNEPDQMTDSAPVQVPPGHFPPAEASLGLGLWEVTGLGTIANFLELKTLLFAS